MLLSSLKIHTDLRTDLARLTHIDDMIKLVETLKERILPSIIDNPIPEIPEVDSVTGIKKLPFYVCQPYIRPPVVEAEAVDGDKKRKPESSEKSVLVKKQKIINPICNGDGCPNTASEICSFTKCKKCCRIYLREAGDSITCAQHSKTKKLAQVKSKEVEENIENIEEENKAEDGRNRSLKI